jgi:hypothetical protein
MKPLLASLVLCLCLCTAFTSKAQDLIIKTNGDTIRAKLMEVGVNTISYKKINLPDGPNYTLDKNEVSFIKHKSGEIEYINKNVSVKTPTSIASPSAAASETNSMTSDQSSSQSKNKIEFVDNKYLINGQKAKRKDVDRYLSKSKNPAIVLGLKGAKAMGTAQKIVKITSYPTTIAGSASSLVSWAEGYQLVQRGRATGKTFVNMGLNLLGTISLPITNKILKKKSDKMYDKLIDMYNVTN